MNNEETFPPSPPEDEEHIRLARAELKKLERRIHELEISNKPKKDSRWAETLRWSVLMVLAIGAVEILWAVPYTVSKRAELAASRIEVNARLAELQIRLSGLAHASSEPGLPSSPSSPTSLANELGVSSRVRDAFYAAAIKSVEQPHSPGAAGQVATTALSILDQLVKAGTATKAEAATLASQLMKAGIDITKDVATEFGKAGAHWLFDEKKDALDKTGRTPSAGNVFNYFTCGASSGPSMQVPPRSPSAPQPTKRPTKPLACSATSAKTKPPAPADAELERK
ncbi:hypothetical protein HQ619_12285 [Burkholderia gladioli]|uniref:hypothetical protein n=1 Tax=Burkholderia gladioli TaxID=28095 RepID=UPI00155FDC08|nr:hypothetical protein [Burkholderia gladioli]NRF84717.1 hypothetical protein [Burkholderia gladioli]